MDIRLVTYNDELVTPLNDALIYEKAVPNNGIFYGYDFAISGNTVISMEGGTGLLYGREFESGGDDIEIQLSSSGVLKGRLYLHMDLANISEPIQILSQVETTLPALIDNPNVNRENGVTELELCTFDVGTTEITNLVKTVPTIDGSFNYKLPKASANELGGIKIGTNLSIDNNGVVSAKDTTYSAATTSADGLMSAADKTKLNGIQASAKNIKALAGKKDTASNTAGTQYTITVDKPSGTPIALIPFAFTPKTSNSTVLRFQNTTVSTGSITYCTFTATSGITQQYEIRYIWLYY